MKRIILPLAGLAILALGSAPAISAQAASTTKNDTSQALSQKTPVVKFLAEIPPPPKQLPVLKLIPQKPPTTFLDRLVESSKSNQSKLTPLSSNPFFIKNRARVPKELIGIVEDEHVKAWANLRTGDAALYPNLSQLAPIETLNETDWQSHYSEVFKSSQLLGADDTRFVIEKPQILNGETLVRTSEGETNSKRPKASYLAYVLARRFVGDYAVDGPGSRAFLAIGNGEAIEGLTRSWKLAKTYQMVEPARNSDQVREDIIRQLQPALANSEVTVQSVDIAYYDGNQSFMQPVYRFTAQIHHRSDQEKVNVADDFVIGFIPFGKTFEPLPSLSSDKGPKPTLANKRVPLGAKSKQAAPNDPVVGRYVVRNDDAGWVNDANSFWNSLASSWTGPLFTNSQYYWAEPRLFTTQKDAFVNSVNLGLIEVHGDWWLYSTLKNCCDLVNINGDIPSPGYGPAANGRLADWVIHSCEVVPAPDDTGSWPSPWWTIFGGLRNVVGYRTIMYISDGAGGPYGTSLGSAAPVVSSWLGDVISLNAYSGRPTSAAHGGIVRPMGRPSTISMCGHDNDSVFSTSSLGRADCVTVWWFPD